MSNYKEMQNFREIIKKILANMIHYGKKKTLKNNKLPKSDEEKNEHKHD